MTSLPASPIDAPRAAKRILAWPRDLRLNPMPGMVYDDMEQGFGWRVRRFNYWRALIGSEAILHVSFPNVVFRNRSKVVTLARYALSATSLRAARFLGRRLVWTVHNLADHESYHPRLEARFMDFYTRLVDLAVHLSEAGREVTMARYPRLGAIQNTVIPHPHYGEIIGERMSREAALARLGLPPDCKLILAFGVVRRYKNLLKLIRAFNDMPGNDTRLLIAGMPLDAGIADAMKRVAGDGRVTLMLRTIKEPEIATLFSAATLVVAPYLEILNSGTAFMSLTYGRPILVPDRGALKELRTHVGDAWIKLFDAPLTPLELGDALYWAQQPRPPAPNLSRFAPERIAASYDEAFAALI
ncbi:MAG TPA: hypothetical protein VID77_13130 [Stellaceae bacterium]